MTDATGKKQVEKKGGLVVLSGPSGSGKTSVVQQLCEYEDVVLSVSATTRPKRPGEQEGRDYYFLTQEEFKARIERGEFVEYNEVFGNRELYGSLKSEVDRGLADPSRYFLMEIDVKGALDLKAQNYTGTYIFVMPPSLEELKNRLVSRGTDSSASIEHRLKKAAWELEQKDIYDLVVVNDELERAVAEVLRYLRLD